MVNFETEPGKRKVPAPAWMLAAAAGFVAAHALARPVGGAPDSARPVAEPPRSAALGAPAPAPLADGRLHGFVHAVVEDANRVWDQDFERRATPYLPAAALLLDAPGEADCGPGLPLDRPACFGKARAYIDLELQRALERRFGEQARGAQAYVLAHEMGHHVQRVLGLDRKLHSLLSERKVASHWAEVQIELQADCLAGVWSRRSELEDKPGPERLEASLRQASELARERRLAGAEPDDTHGESFTYAIPSRRFHWFARGYSQGSVDDCDTFAP